MIPAFLKQVCIAVLFVLEHGRLEEFVGVGVAFSRGAYAPPFCVVQHLSAPFNASSACWKMLSIRRREVFKGFRRVKPKLNQIKAVTCRLSE